MLHENNYIVGSQVGRESSPISVAKIYKHICGLQDCIVVVFANEKNNQNCQNSSEFVFGEYRKLIKFKQICFSENNDADNKTPYSKLLLKHQSLGRFTHSHAHAFCMKLCFLFCLHHFLWSCFQLCKQVKLRWSGLATSSYLALGF